MPRRTDDNQNEIVKTLRQIGAEWIDTSADPRAGCDGIIAYHGRTIVVEIKNGSLPPSARKLTDNELKTKAKCERAGAPYVVLLSAEHAVEVLSEFR